MASSTLGFTLIHSLPSRTLWVTSGFLNHPFLKSHVSTVSSSSSNHINQLKLKQFPLPRASSSEEASSELIEDSKFVPLNADDSIYGPPALLLLGFEVEETVKQPNARKRNTKMQQLLKELDGEFLQVILCTEDMITSSLWEAMHTRQTHLETVKVAKSLPRICFLSGLSGEEMMMFIDAFPETGLESAVFAALVPNSADKPLQELIEEIMGDHEMMTANQSSST